MSKIYAAVYKFFPLVLIIGCLLIANGQSAPARAGYDSPSQPASPAWLLVETPHFLIHYTAHDKYFSKELTAMAEKSYRLVTGHIGLYPSQKIVLYLANSRELFTRLQPFRSPLTKQAIGLAYPGLGRILLLSPRAESFGRIQLEKTFIHELTHIVLGSSAHNKSSSSPVSIPLWFNEGLSMYEAKEWNWRYQALMTRICITRTIIPFRSLEYSFPSEPGRLQAAYAQSISLISFIFDKYGQDSLRKITRFLIQGDKIDSALQKTLGLDLDELELLWKKRLRLVYTWVPLLTSSAVLWFIISLIFLLVYQRKKQTSQAKIEAWREDEIEDWLRNQLDDL